MRVNRICSSYVNQKKSNINKQNQPSFAAKKLPVAGEVADWIYELALTDGMKGKIESTRIYLDDLDESLSTYFNKRFLRKREEIRNKIYDNIIQDILEKHKPVDIGQKPYDKRYRYANQYEFEQNKAIFGDDKVPLTERQIANIEASRPYDQFMEDKDPLDGIDPFRL